MEFWEARTEMTTQDLKKMEIPTTLSECESVGVIS